jgi:hypothetical protein
MAVYSGPDGITHATRKNYNSATGRMQIAEMRRGMTENAGEYE